MSKVRGSYYVDGRRSLTIPAITEDNHVDVGFRLVYEDGERHDRGSPWTESCWGAHTASSHRSFAKGGFSALGFRLVWEMP